MEKAFKNQPQLIAARPLPSRAGTSGREADEPVCMGNVLYRSRDSGQTKQAELYSVD
jgi:hypothetical protein